MCSPKMGRGGYDVTYSAAGDLIDGNERKKADEEVRSRRIFFGIWRINNNVRAGRR